MIELFAGALLIWHVGPGTTGLVPGATSHHEPSHKVIDGFISILLDQLNHTLRRLQSVTKTDPDQGHKPYLRHDRLAISTLYISEGHLGTLVVVELQLREVEVRHIGDRN